MSRILAYVAVAVLALPAVAGDVLTVGPSGSDFLAIQPAVDAAADSDVILVKAGTYAGFAIDAKSVRVVADTGATVEVSSPVAVRSVAAGGSVVLAGMRIRAAGTRDRFSLLVSDAAGSVRVIACRIGSAAVQGEVPRPGARVVASADVAFTACVLQGMDSPPHWARPGDGFAGGSGIDVEESRVSLHDCTCAGGLGGLAYPGWTGGAGGDACAVFGATSFLHASGSSFQGGAGADGNEQHDCIDFAAGDGGEGGDGIQAGGHGLPPPSILLLAPTYAGGAGGHGGHGACGPDGLDGAAGSALDLAPGTQLAQISGAARRMSMPDPVRESAPVQVTFTGAPNDSVRLTMWDQPGFLYVPGYGGVLLVHAPLLRRIPVGTIPASGVLQTTMAFPALPAGVDARTYFLQPTFTDPTSAVRLGSSFAVVVLDSSF